MTEQVGRTSAPSDSSLRIVYPRAFAGSGQVRILTSTFFSLLGLLSGTGLFVIGVGLLSTALALRATALGFPALLTGFIMAAYFVGFVVGTHVGPKIVVRVGHVRAFSAFAATAAAALLLHPLWQSAAVWALLRFITGSCVVGLYMVIESWINERSTNEVRGRVFAVYQLISLASLAVGQALIVVGGDPATTPFLLAGALLSIGLVPVVLTRVLQPAPISQVKLDLRALWRISPLGVAGTLVSALTQSAFFALGPVFAHNVGLGTAGIALFMSLALLGGAALQWPIGHFSDRVDRRKVILGAAIAAAGVAAGCWWLVGAHLALLPALVFFYGGLASSLYPLCVAYSNDHASSSDAVATASGLLLVYGLGASVGPILMGITMQIRGPAAFWSYLIVMLLVLAVVVLVRMRLREPPAAEGHEPFIMLARTSQSALEVLAPDDSAPKPSG